MTETAEQLPSGTTEVIGLLICRVFDFIIQLDFENNRFWAVVQCLLVIAMFYVIGCIIVSIVYAIHRY